MFAHLPRPGNPSARGGATVRRSPAPGRRQVPTAATCALLDSAAIIPAAFARVIPPPGGQYGPTRVAPASVHVITTSGMAGWQITLIALGAALLAAAAAVLLDRPLAARRTASAPTIYRAPPGPWTIPATCPGPSQGPGTGLARQAGGGRAKHELSHHRERGQKPAARRGPQPVKYQYSGLR